MLPLSLIAVANCVEFVVQRSLLSISWWITCWAGKIEIPRRHIFLVRLFVITFKVGKIVCWFVCKQVGHVRNSLKMKLEGKHNGLRVGAIFHAGYFAGAETPDPRNIIWRMRLETVPVLHRWALYALACQENRDNDRRHVSSSFGFVHSTKCALSSPFFYFV